MDAHPVTDLATSDPRHGTVSTYINHRCRCAKCRAANTIDTHKRRMARKGTEPARHGLESSYSNWGCRCQECKTAHATYRRDFRRAKRSST